jgi:hypothetical protein
MTSTLRLQGSRIIADWPSIPFSGTTVERIEIRPPPFGQEIIRQKMIGNSLDMDQYVFQPAAARGSLECCGRVSSVFAF